MIRFANPWVLLAIPAVVALLGFLFRRHWLRWGVRACLLAVLLLALARPEISLVRQDRSTMILLDRSESLRVAQSDVDTFALIQELVDANPDQEFGLIEFSDAATLVYPPGEYRPSIFPAIEAAPATHLQPAVDLALASMNGGQVVLLSDGRFSDDAGVAAARAQAVDVPLHVLPIGKPVTADLSLTSLTAPSETAVGRPFALRVDVAAPAPTTARLVVYRDEQLLLAEDVTLSQGRNSFAFTDTLEAEGVFSYRAFVRNASDPISNNDSLSTSVQSAELASVLVLDGAGTGIVPRLLDAAGFSYDTTTTVPSMETLSQYRQLILADVELAQITGPEAERVDHFVRNMGGGLFVIQGERAVRGFTSTELDDLLPISSTVPEVQHEASLAIVFVLDRSTSMKGLVRTPATREHDTAMHAKIRIVRDATAASVSLLPSNTQVGIIGFDTTFDWLRPVSPIDDLAGIMGILRRLSAGGGTDIYYPLEAAVSALEDLDARFKHILLISDGWTTVEPRDYDGLLARLRADGDIVVSIIAADEKPNFELLDAIAEAGHGEVYHVPQFANLPATMLDITQRLSRSRFVVEPSEVSGILAERLAPLSIPPVDGYILTYPRSEATVYASAGDDPLFATWNVGLGVVSALNTDLTGAWTGAWTAWSAMSQLFAEMVVLSEPDTFTSSGLHASVAVDEHELKVLVDARDEAGEYANWLSLSAELLPIRSESDLRQVAPGLYEASFERPASGGYALRITDATRASVVQIPVTVPYPTEYAATGADRDALASLASLTGGAVLSRGDLVLTEERRFPHRAYVPIHLPLLFCAAAILLAELIALRWPRRRIREPSRGPGTS